MFVPSHSSPRRRLLATLLAVTLPAAALPTPAEAAPVLALFADDKVTPEAAASARKSVQERSRGLRKSDPGAGFDWPLLHRLTAWQEGVFPPETA